MYAVYLTKLRIRLTTLECNGGIGCILQDLANNAMGFSRTVPYWGHMTDNLVHTKQI